MWYAQSIFIESRPAMQLWNAVYFLDYDVLNLKHIGDEYQLIWESYNMYARHSWMETIEPAIFKLSLVLVSRENVQLHCAAPSGICHAPSDLDLAKLNDLCLGIRRTCIVGERRVNDLTWTRGGTQHAHWNVDDDLAKNSSYAQNAARSQRKRRHCGQAKRRREEDRRSDGFWLDL